MYKYRLYFLYLHVDILGIRGIMYTRMKITKIVHWVRGIVGLTYRSGGYTKYYVFL